MVSHQAVKPEAAGLCIDDMLIMKKHNEDFLWSEREGCVDLFEGTESDKLATMSLTIIIHSIEQKWKISRKNGK